MMFKCDDCKYAGTLSMRGPFSGPKMPIEDPKILAGENTSGMEEYFKNVWCWCSHKEHHEKQDHFHRMMMRYNERETCVPLKVLFEHK